MYFVGIDISKFKHDCAIIDEIGDVIMPSWSFNNDLEGFSILREVLSSLQGDIKIGLESTGHYGQNLKLFLESNGFSFMECNPLLISRFVRSKSLRKTKTDSIDAVMIAQHLMTVKYKPYPASFYHMDKLKSLCKSFQDAVLRRSGARIFPIWPVGAYRAHGQTWVFASALCSLKLLPSSHKKRTYLCCLLC